MTEGRRSRYRVLPGSTYKVATPLGSTYVTINRNGDGEPFEVFVITGKAGSETTAVSEALGRLISYILRMDGSAVPTDRLREVATQLGGIGGSRPLGFGQSRVLSLPDGIARAIEIHFGERQEEKDEATFVDLCPDCGESTLFLREGCESCDNCGYSRC